MRSHTRNVKRILKKIKVPKDSLDEIPTEDSQDEMDTDDTNTSDEENSSVGPVKSSISNLHQKAPTETREKGRDSRLRNIERANYKLWSELCVN